MTEINAAVSDAQQDGPAGPRITAETLVAAHVPDYYVAGFRRIFPDGVIPTRAALLPYLDLGVSVSEAIEALLTGEGRPAALAAVDHAGAALEAAHAAHREALLGAFVDGWAAQHAAAPAASQEAAAPAPGEPVKLTADFLRSRGACGYGVAAFERHFPDGVVPTREAVGDAIYDVDLTWAISELLEHGVVRERAFDAQVEPMNTYHAALAAAHAAYGAAPVGDERRDAYGATVNAALRALREVQADIFAAAWLEQHPTPAE